MALSRPLIKEEHLPMGVARELDNNGPGGMNYIIERPAQDGLPEVIRIVDDDDGNLPILISRDEEEVGEVEIAVDEGEVELYALDEDLARSLLLADIEDDEEEEEVGQVEVGVLDEGELIPRFLSDDEDEDEEEEDALCDWESMDSGYGSIYEESEVEEEVEEGEEEEDEEDSEDDDGNIRPCSPPTQRLPPRSFCQGFRQGLDFSLPPPPSGVLPAQQVVRPGEGRPSVHPRSPESAPSTSGLSYSTKRSREEDCTEQVGVKRQRQCEDSREEAAPSTSGLGSSTTRSTEEDNRYGFRRYWQRPPADRDSDSD